MFTKVSDFLESWKYESEATSKLLGLLTDPSLAQAVTPEGRTLGRLAWHITTTIPEMMERTGLHLGLPPHDAPVPASARAIAAAYREAATALARILPESWTDATLSVEDEMYGMKWTRGVTLGVLISHQTHHRGQMTVLMRQAGLGMAGVYGPAREEWAAMGVPVPEI